MSWSRSIIMRHFYPRPPRGGRLELALLLIDGGLFLSTPSARRATQCLIDGELEIFISIHALREEGDQSCTLNLPCHDNFYPRPPRGGRRSIHRLRLSVKLFLSTPSARRATRHRAEGQRPLHDFYPRPPRGGRLPQLALVHAIVRFLSTPSARRATFPFAPPHPGGDNFYPRPPRGGRQAPCSVSQAGYYFYPRPPRGGRRFSLSSKGTVNLFLSTPSARRATKADAATAPARENFYPRPPRGGRL